MKKKILFLIILLLIPTLVLAKDTCNDNDIKIKSITLKELNGFSEEIQESSINNNTINLNLKMYDVGDSSTYDITVENTSNEDYYFTKDSMKLENDYLEYSLKNDSEVIPAKNEKTIELKVSYKNKISNESYSDTSKLIISLSDKPLENPKTKMTYTFIFIIISLIILTIYKKINNKLFSKKKLFLIGTLLSIIPLTTTALCTVNLNVETKIEIENKEAIFLPGSEVNIKMKELAGDDTSTSTNGFDYKNESIVAVKYSSQEPTVSNKEEKNIVSTYDSPYPIYMWYEDCTIYWWSEDSHPSLNEDASYMFYHINSLNNIDGLESFDVSNVKKLSFTLSNTAIDTLSSIKKWNVSSVEDMSGLFFDDINIKSLEGIEGWDISNVINMSEMFSGERNKQMQIESLNELRKWNTSKLENMSSMFACNTKLETLEGLENWDTSNIKNMRRLFDYNLNLKDALAIKNWNTSNVTNLECMFQHTYKLEKIDVSNWNTSNVIYMNHLFGAGYISLISNLKEIKGIENWDTSNVISMESMFVHQVNLEELNLSGWDTSNVKNMKYMFSGTNLKRIYVSEKFNTRNVTNSTEMFARASYYSGLSETPTLVGGNGTNWNENYIDKTYARIDTEENPGYFTLNPN